MGPEEIQLRQFGAGKVLPAGIFCASFSCMSTRDVWLQEAVEPPSWEVSKIDVAVIYQWVDICIQ